MLEVVWSYELDMKKGGLPVRASISIEWLRDLSSS
jgi:hypothetical protein